VWEWKNDDAFGNNAADENPNGANSVNGAAAAFTYNLRFPGQYLDKETGTNYNYFRDYDPATGRYVQSDPIGLKGGINTYGYVGGGPLTKIDSKGLTEADVQGVWRDVLASFTELNPEVLRIKFREIPSYSDGQTSNWSGQIWVPLEKARIPCFNKEQYVYLFFMLFHEGMHSTDSWIRRAFGTTDEYHDTIHRRANFELTRVERTPIPSAPMWGKPRTTPVDIDRLYAYYLKRTPACCN
jgi:RHS repeat-associated protein